MTSPLDTQIAAELERLAGGLDLLYRLRAELTLRCDEGNSKASREALDEVLTLLASLETEYPWHFEAWPSAQSGNFVSTVNTCGSRLNTAVAGSGLWASIYARCGRIASHPRAGL